MKLKVLVAILAVGSLALASCAQSKDIHGVTYSGYGLLNSGDKKNDSVEYQPVWGNVFWGVVLVETIVAPIYFFGFSLFEPVGPKCAVKGVVNC
jgi:hypothetical protein